MKKFIIFTFVLATVFAAGTAQAGVFGRRNRGTLVQPTPVAVASALTPTASTEGNYRTFSYQPLPANVTSLYRTVERQPALGIVSHDAGWKIRGF